MNTTVNVSTLSDLFCYFCGTCGIRTRAICILLTIVITPLNCGGPFSKPARTFVWIGEGNNQLPSSEIGPFLKYIALRLLV